MALKADSITVYNMEKEVVSKTPFHVDWDVSLRKRAAMSTFMFKGNYGTAGGDSKTISPRLKNGKIVLDDVSLSKRGFRENQ